MTIKVLSSGSQGNCYVIEDTSNNQLLLECGIKFDEICQHIDFNKVNCCLVSHSHLDHSKSKDKIIGAFIDTYYPGNIQDAKPIFLKNWTILPIKLTHNVDCFGYLISNKVENKTLLFATDTTSLPNIADSEFDCMLIECNYNFDKVIDNGQNGLLTNDGYKNHMALEELVDWLRFRENKPKNLVAIHLSNNGNIDEELTTKELSKFTKNFHIAKKGVTIEL